MNLEPEVRAGLTAETSFKILERNWLEFTCMSKVSCVTVTESIEMGPLLWVTSK